MPSPNLEELRQKVVSEINANPATRVDEKTVNVQLSENTLARVKAIQLPWESDRDTIARIAYRGDAGHLPLEGKSEVSSTLYAILNGTNDLILNSKTWEPPPVDVKVAKKIDPAVKARMDEIRGMEGKIIESITKNQPLQKHHLLGLLWSYCNHEAFAHMGGRWRISNSMETVAEDDFHKAMYEVVVRSEYFIFNKVEDHIVNQEGVERFKMMLKFGIKYPYPMSVYQALADTGDGFKGQIFQVIIDTREVSLVNFPALASYAGTVIIAEYALVAKVGSMSFAPLRGLAVDFDCGPDRIEYDVLFRSTAAAALPNEGADPGFAHDQLPITLRANAYLNMSLHVKNIPMERHEVPEKLAKARAKNKLPKLYPYTIVRTDTYERAKAETRRMEKAGHRTSPCMHTRRGHPRHLKNKELPIWIHETIVNCNATEVVQRDAYKVKK